MSNQEELWGKLHPLFNNSRQWSNLTNYLDFLVEQQHKILEQSQENVALYKAQGAIELLKHIKSLRQNVMGNK
jgi:hypothetical protein